MKTLIKNGLVLDGAGVAFADHGVLVNEDKIERFAPAAEFDGFEGQVIDLDGDTLLPGLIDCHVHLCYAGEPNPGRAIEDMDPGEIAVRALSNAQDSVRGGITAVRDCGGVNYLEFSVRDACNAGKFMGPTIRAAGRMICMTGGHGNRFGRVADGVDEVIKAVR